MHSLVVIIKRKYRWLLLMAALFGGVMGVYTVAATYDCEIYAWFSPHKKLTIRPDISEQAMGSIWDEQHFLLVTANREKCQVLDFLQTANNPIETVNVLLEKARNLFHQENYICALVAIDKASRIVKDQPSGQERTIAGYEIKEVVFQAIEDKKLADSTLQREAVRLSLQSLLPNGQISPVATIPERINDSAFLFRMASWMKKEKNQNDPSEYILLMLQFAKTIEADKRPYGSYDMVLLAEYMLEQSAYANIVRMLKEMPCDDDKTRVVASLMSMINNNLGIASRNDLLIRIYENKGSPSSYSGISFDKATTLRYADEAEQMLQVIKEEATAIKRESKTQYPFPYNLLHKFIWQSYLVAGSRCEARNKLKSWITAIRQIEDPGIRFNSLFAASQDIYKTKVEKSVAISLFHEAEEEAKRFTDPKCRKSALESIARNKIWLK